MEWDGISEEKVVEVARNMVILWCKVQRIAIKEQDMKIEATSRNCTICNLEKDNSEFYSYMGNGKLRLGSQCKTCQSNKGKAERALLPKAEPKPGKLKSRPEDYPTKKCRDCGVTKDRAEFGLAKTGIGGLTPECKDCRNEQWRKDNPRTYRLEKEVDGVMLKHCIECDEYLPFDKFYFSGKPAAKEAGVLRSQCKCCSTKKERDQYRTENPEIKVRPRIVREILDPGFRYCNLCDTEKTISEFYADRTENRTSDFSKICKLCDDSVSKLRKQTLAGRFTTYKSCAKYSKRVWNLTKEEFSEFWQKPCYYCGVAIETVGIDRIDSSLGYSASNTKSCCFSCNQAKSNQPLDEFLNQVKRLYSNLDGIRNLTSVTYPPNKTHCFECGELISDHTIKCSTSIKSVALPSDPIENKAERARRAKIRGKTPRGKYSQYKSRATARSIEWKLSEIQFFSMWRKPCSYCLKEKSTIGIDRLDSKIGYLPGLNTIVSCGRCNAAKMSSSLGEFADWIERIGTHLKSKSLI